MQVKYYFRLLVCLRTRKSVLIQPLDFHIKQIRIQQMKLVCDVNCMCLSSKHINAYLKAKMSTACTEMSPRRCKALKITPENHSSETILRLQHYP